MNGPEPAPAKLREVRSEIGLRIARYRQARGWPQKELAARAGSRVQRLSLLENGHSVPNVMELLRLRQVFDVSFDELVTGKPPKVRAHRASLQDALRRIEQVCNADQLWLLAEILDLLGLIVQGGAGDDKPHCSGEGETCA